MRFKGLRVYLFLLFPLMYSSYAQSISLVYNLKIRRVFNVPQLGTRNNALLIATAVPIMYKRDRHIVLPEQQTDVYEKRITFGSLFNFRYSPSRSYWAEVATGLEKERVHSQGTHTLNASRTGFDDIVCAAGYNFFPTNQIQCDLYVIGGVPTTKKVSLIDVQDTLVGTRFYSVGAGSELSYSYLNNERLYVAVLQVRSIHFFNRRWTPLLPVDAKIIPGNVTDLLFAGQYGHHMTLYEIGYNPTFFTNQAVHLATRTIKSPHFIRHSMYARLTHLISEFEPLAKPLVIGCGINLGGSDHFDTRIYSCWLNVSTIF